MWLIWLPGDRGSQGLQPESLPPHPPACCPLEDPSPAVLAPAGIGRWGARDRSPGLLPWNLDPQSATPAPMPLQAPTVSQLLPGPRNAKPPASSSLATQTTLHRLVLEQPMRPSPSGEQNSDMDPKGALWLSTELMAQEASQF